MSHLTKEDIERQLQGDASAYYNKVYDGKNELPKDFTVYFRRAWMLVPDNTFQINGYPVPNNKLKLMFDRGANELSNLEVGMIINILFSVPKKYWLVEDETEPIDFELALDVHRQLSAIRDDYNKTIGLLNQSLEKKKKRLYELAGIDKNAAQYKPLAKA